jgi:hypothetical protein
MRPDTVEEIAQWLESAQAGLRGDERVQEAAKLLRRQHKLLERWFEMYGGSTCRNKREQKKMTKLDLDTEEWFRATTDRRGAGG